MHRNSVKQSTAISASSQVVKANFFSENQAISSVIQQRSNDQGLKILNFDPARRCGVST